MRWNFCGLLIENKEVTEPDSVRYAASLQAFKEAEAEVVRKEREFLRKHRLE
jgi:hypothetical protein